jgi:plasmid stability protein
MAHPGSAPLTCPAMTRLETAREVLRQMLLTDAQPAVRKAAVAAGVLVLLGASEAYSGSVTRTLRSIRRHAGQRTQHGCM